LTSFANGGSVRTSSDFDVPSAGRVVLGGIWWSWPDDDPGALLAISAQLVPFQPPVPTFASVGRLVVSDPRSYLRLLSAARLGSACRGPWMGVTIRSVEPSPWTDGEMDVRLSRRQPCLWVDGWPYRLPVRAAREARRGLPIAA
jgi:hypothetical protein